MSRPTGTGGPMWVSAIARGIAVGVLLRWLNRRFYDRGFDDGFSCAAGILNPAQDTR